MKNSTKLLKNLICFIAFILIANFLKAQPLSLQLTPSDFNGYNVSCMGFQNGSIDATVTGGTAPYTYLWSNDVTTEDISNLPAGFFAVTVTDANSNTATAQITLTEPLEFSISLEPSEFILDGRRYNISCPTCFDGFVNTTLTNGIAPVSYLWENNATTQNRSGLPEGTYKNVATDDNGCISGTEIYLDAPERTDWQMSGNTDSDPNTNFIGTLDNQDLVFKTFNNERLRLKSNGDLKINSFIGTGSKLVFADGNGNLLSKIISIADITMPGVACTDPPNPLAWRHKQSATPNIIYTCTDRVGIGNDNPHEYLEIGEKFTFHSGGSKFISLNSYWNGVRRRISADAVSSLNFHNNGDFEFLTLESGGAPDDDIEAGIQSRMYIKNGGDIGIGTTNPTEQLQIGDRWTFHNGGSKVIGYNFDYTASGSLRLVDGYSQTIGFDASGNISFKTAGNGSAGSTITYNDGILINSQGNVAIGTGSVPDNSYKLTVCGDVRCKKVKVQSGGWCDFVFDKDYKLMPLLELDEFLKRNKHLPEIPTAAEIESDGLDLGELVKKQMQKIEELTLYVIELKKDNESLKSRINKIEGGK